MQKNQTVLCSVEMQKLSFGDAFVAEFGFTNVFKINWAEVKHWAKLLFFDHFFLNRYHFLIKQDTDSFLCFIFSSLECLKFEFTRGVSTVICNFSLLIICIKFRLLY